MPPDLLHSLLSSLGGLLALAVFGAAFFRIWSHRRPQGPLRRGLALRNEPLDDSLVEPLRRLEGVERAAWGWYRAEADTLLVFVDPCYRGEGHMRIRTLWPYVAEVRFGTTGAQVAYRTPLLPTVLLGPLFLPLLGMPLIFHAILLARVRLRLRLLAE